MALLNQTTQRENDMNITYNLSISTVTRTAEGVRVRSTWDILDTTPRTRMNASDRARTLRKQHPKQIIDGLTTLTYFTLVRV